MPDKLTLQGDPPLTLNDDALVANGELEVSGVVTSVGHPKEGVEGANVTVELVQGDKVFRTFSGETDAGGGFTVSGRVPATPGTYRLAIDVSKGGYDASTMRSDKTIDVSYETGMQIQAPDLPKITLGETTRIPIDIVNTGQADVEEFDLSVSGVDYATVTGVPDTLPNGSTRTIIVKLSLPSDWCSRPCVTPQLTLRASGTAAGEDITARTSVPTRLPDRERSDRNASSTQQNGTSPAGSASSGSMVPDVVTPTANFIESQSDVNIALAVILLFGVLLALAVKRRNSGPDMRGRDVRHSRIDKPKVSPSGATQPEAPSEDEIGTDDDDVDDTSA
ncbi:MAG: hypothetical protein ABEK12_02675, partial [Candidatus Nanohaloarchaea archaeon]